MVYRTSPSELFINFVVFPGKVLTFSGKYYKSDIVLVDRDVFLRVYTRKYDIDMFEHSIILCIRDGKTRPGPRAETGLMIFYLRFLCSLCAGRSVVTKELCIVVTCKCVVYCMEQM